jgi:hypothetical protein
MDITDQHADPAAATGDNSVTTGRAPDHRSEPTSVGVVPRTSSCRRSLTRRLGIFPIVRGHPSERSVRPRRRVSLGRPGAAHHSHRETVHRPWPRPPPGLAAQAGSPDCDGTSSAPVPRIEPRTRTPRHRDELDAASEANRRSASSSTAPSRSRTTCSSTGGGRARSASRHWRRSWCSARTDASTVVRRWTRADGAAASWPPPTTILPTAHGQRDDDVDRRSVAAMSSATAAPVT